MAPPTTHSLPARELATFIQNLESGGIRFASTDVGELIEGAATTAERATPKAPPSAPIHRLWTVSAGGGEVQLLASEPKPSAYIHVMMSSGKGEAATSLYCAVDCILVASGAKLLGARKREACESICACGGSPIDLPLFAGRTREYSKTDRLILFSVGSTQGAVVFVRDVLPERRSWWLLGLAGPKPRVAAMLGELGSHMSHVIRGSAPHDGGYRGKEE